MGRFRTGRTAVQTAVGGGIRRIDKQTANILTLPGFIGPGDGCGRRAGSRRDDRRPESAAHRSSRQPVKERWL